MKKLISLLLIVALLIPVCALASESDIVGCWACYQVLTDGAPCMSMLVLAENHTCYYLIQSYHTDEPGLGRAYVGTWELKSDGTLYAKTGNNSDVTLKFSDSLSLAVDLDTMDVYVNITPFTFD